MSLRPHQHRGRSPFIKGPHKDLPDLQRMQHKWSVATAAAHKRSHHQYSGVHAPATTVEAIHLKETAEHWYANEPRCYTHLESECKWNDARDAPDDGLIPRGTDCFMRRPAQSADGNFLDPALRPKKLPPALCASLRMKRSVLGKMRPLSGSLVGYRTFVCAIIAMFLPSCRHSWIHER